MFSGRVSFTFSSCLVIGEIDINRHKDTIKCITSVGHQVQYQTLQRSNRLYYIIGIYLRDTKKCVPFLLASFDLLLSGSFTYRLTLNGSWFFFITNSFRINFYRICTQIRWKFSFLIAFEVVLCMGFLANWISISYTATPLPLELVIPLNVFITISMLPFPKT